MRNFGVADYFWLGASIAVVAMGFAWALTMDKMFRRRDRQAVLDAAVRAQRVLGNVEGDPPPPIDFAEAIRRRARR